MTGEAVDAPPVVVVGLIGGQSFGSEAADRLAEAEVLVGSRRQFDLLAGSVPDGAERIDLAGPLDALLDRIDRSRSAARRVAVLASGDPGFFGIVRALGQRFGTDALEVHPAPSSTAMAFARIGTSWDDAIVVSVHGRPLDRGMGAIGPAAKAAVLTSPDNPPEAVGSWLRSAGCRDRDAVVVTRIGEPDEAVHRVDVDELADGSFDPMSVVLLLPPRLPAASPPGDPTLRWGRPETEFDHRDGMITKSEVRAVALGKLALPATGVIWDIGSGSGSVAVECALLRPGLSVTAVDRDAEQVERTRANAERHGARVDAVLGTAPEALAGLADPDRAFVGGGGIDVLDAVIDRLRPGGVVVATYAVVERAVAARERLGSLVQLGVSRSAPISDLGFRLVPENPIFVCWGPGHAAEPQEGVR